MEYKYKIGKASESKSGYIEANSREEAAGLIKKEGWSILELKEKSLTSLQMTFGNATQMTDFERISFTDHLASMIGAGTPIREALEAYSEDGEKKSEVINRIVQDIERGKALSVALSNFPKLFSPLYIALVKAGETSGSLDETLGYLANELRREHEFKQRIKSAMFYPIIVITVSIAVIILVVTTVIPKVSEITKSLGGEMPFMTRMVVGFSDFLVSNYPFITILVIGLIATLFVIFKKENNRQKVKDKLLKSPLVGPIIRKYTLARFLRIIGSSVKYGIALPVAFEAAQDVVNNSTYKEAVIRINKKITKGESLAGAISAEDKFLFPGVITRSLKGAEKTGSLDTTLQRLALQFELEVDRDLKRATELLEPIMVVVLGVIVLGIAVSVIAPIYELTSNIK